jgi:uncharacterized membrane-anchored protein YhcB (DUF1043 family)
MSIDPLNPLTHLDSSPKEQGWFSYFAKPAVMLVVALVFGYVTMWLSTNFVRQDKFAAYVDKQIESDQRQDEVLKSRFDITQQKLEQIINQQVSYTEQLKAYNQVMLGIQKQVDNIDDRLKYVERLKEITK